MTRINSFLDTLRGINEAKGKMAVVQSDYFLSNKRKVTRSFVSVDGSGVTLGDGEREKRDDKRKRAYA